MLGKVFNYQFIWLKSASLEHCCNETPTEEQRAEVLVQQVPSLPG